jgi:O-antigen/teichoic acid export membrane protein
LSSSRVASRALGSIIDQGVSSLTSFVILFASLRFLALEELGIFTIAYNTVFLVVGLVRPLNLDPLVVRFASASPSERDAAAADALGLSLGLGLLCIFLGGISSLAVTPHASIFLTLSVTVAIALIQDGWRMYFVSAGQPWSAVLNDAVSLIVTASVLAIAFQLTTLSVTTLLGVWAIGLGAGVALGFLRTSIIPAPWRALNWLRSVGGLGYRLAAETALDRLAAQISLVVIGGIAGAAVVGQVGGARTLMTPVLTIVSGAVIFLVPEAALLHAKGDRQRLARLAIKASATLATAVLAFTLAALATPDSLGEAAVGDNWNAAAPLILPVGIWTAAAAARYGPRAALHAMEEATLTLRIALATAPLLILATALGTLLGGAWGASWGFACSHCLATVMWWVATRRALQS